MALWKLYVFKKEKKKCEIYGWFHGDEKKWGCCVMYVLNSETEKNTSVVAKQAS